MKKEIRQIILISGILWGGIAQSQIRIANSTINIAVPGSSAFIDASSNPIYNSSTNVGKGLLYPRVDLTTFTSFGGVPIGLPTSFPTYYDGFVVYNTNVGGVAGVGITQGTLTSGFWYYDNKSGTINGGTWKPFTAASSGATTNVLSSSGNTITSNVNGISSTAPAINSNALSLSESSLTSTVNGIASNAVNLAPAITAATTNLLSSSGNTMTSTVNGIARTAPIVNSVTNTVSGNTLTTTVNGISSGSVTLPQGVNIYNSDGTLTGDRMVSTNNKMLWFQNGTANTNNHIAFDINAAVPGSTRLITRGSSSSLIRALIASSRTLDMELLTNGTSRLLSTGSTELFVGTNTSSGPLVFGVGTNRAILATNGNFGIGTTTPSQKLDVDGNARFRNVPNGTMANDDSYLGITSSGTLKKIDVALPSLALYATSTQSVLRNADNVARPFAIQNTNKINSDYIERVNSNTFRAKKSGIYTIEIWGKFSSIPTLSGIDNDGTADGRLGATLRLTTGGNTIQLIGSRWNHGEGTTNVTRTVILSINETISVESLLSRTNGQYNETSGSTIFITYMPL